MFSKEKLNKLANLGLENKNSEFEFEGKYFEVVEEESFAYDNEHYGASIHSITNINNKRASLYVVVDNSVGNEDCDIKITASYKEAFKAYNDFKNLIKSAYSKDEALKRKQLWFESLQNYKIESSIYGDIRIAYDRNIAKFIFITFSNYEDGGYSYGINEDLTLSDDEMYDIDGSEIPYEFGLNDIEDVLKYLKDVDFHLKDWHEEDLREFALSQGK